MDWKYEVIEIWKDENAVGGHAFDIIARQNDLRYAEQVMIDHTRMNKDKEDFVGTQIVDLKDYRRISFCNKEEMFELTDEDIERLDEILMDIADEVNDKGSLIRPCITELDVIQSNKDNEPVIYLEIDDPDPIEAEYGDGGPDAESVTYNICGDWEISLMDRLRKHPTEMDDDEIHALRIDLTGAVDRSIEYIDEMCFNEAIREADDRKRNRYDWF